MKHFLLLFYFVSLLMPFCLRAEESFTLESYQDEQFQADLRKMERASEIRRYVWSLRKGEHKRLMRLVVGRVKSLEILPGESFNYIAPSGIFAVLHYPDGSYSFSGSLEKSMSRIMNPLTLFSKAQVYIGYYKPDKKTGKLSVLPGREDKLYFYIFPKEFFRTLKPEERQKMVERESEPITAGPEDLIIRPLKPPTAFKWVLLFFTFPIFGGAFAFFYRIVGKPGFETDFAAKKIKSSMRNLWTLSNKKNFLCVHCGEPLKIKDRFACPAGHIPKKERYIFRGCYRDNYQFTNISCNHCGRVINLDEAIYNEEEIKNRGREYISIKSPLSKSAFMVTGLSFVATLVYMGLISTPFKYSLWNITAVVKIYISRHGFLNYVLYIEPFFIFVAALFIVALITLIYGKTRKEVLIKNPYV